LQLSRIRRRWGRFGCRGPLWRPERWGRRRARRHGPWVLRAMVPAPSATRGRGQSIHPRRPFDDPSGSKCQIATPRPLRWPQMREGCAIQMAADFRHGGMPRGQAGGVAVRIHAARLTWLSRYRNLPAERATAAPVFGRPLPAAWSTGPASGNFSRRQHEDNESGLRGGGGYRP
jgi:hypothetical protein